MAVDESWRLELLAALDGALDRFQARLKVMMTEIDEKIAKNKSKKTINGDKELQPVMDEKVVISEAEIEVEFAVEAPVDAIPKANVVKIQVKEDQPIEIAAKGKWLVGMDGDKSDSLVQQPNDDQIHDHEWIFLIRSHAEVIVDDEVVLPVFKKFCKRRPPLDTSKGKLNIKLQKQHNCIPDEHYMPTLFALSELEGELERRTLTYTLWYQSAEKMDNKAWHPVTYNYADASPKRLKEIKDINHVNYESEFRTEWCRTNSTFVPCFLFARKFSQGAAMRLLSEGVVEPFEVSSLLGNPS